MQTPHSLIFRLYLFSLTCTQRISLPLLSVGIGVVLMDPCMSAPFQFEATGSLHTQRSVPTTTLLPNGKVLVAG